MMAKFNGASTAEEVAAGFNLEGKNVIITGGYAGIGRETARVFAERGAHVFIIGRDMVKCNKVVEEIRAETGKQRMQIDLSSLASVRTFSENFNQLNIPLHFLINNAGIMCCPKSKSVDGIETHMATNHFGHFLLTNLLMPHLIEGAPSRVVNVSAVAYAIAPSIRWDDMDWDKGCYGGWQGYAQSKLANILFTVELNRRYKDQGVISNSLHPGIIKTDLQRHVSWSLIRAFPSMMTRAPRRSFTQKTLQQGAATTVYAALHPDASAGGKYYDDCHEEPVTAYATNAEDARRLWDVSTRRVGLPNL